MNLSFLLDALISNRKFNGLLIEIAEKADRGAKIHFSEAVTPIILGTLINKLRLPILILSSEPESSSKLYHRLQELMGDTTDIHYFPEKQTWGVTKSDLENTTIRLSTLFQISQVFQAKTAIKNNLMSQIVISNIVAASERIISPSKFQNSNQLLEKGMAFEKEKFLTALLKHGYVLEDRVEVPGTFSQRGGIIDIYPMTSVLPVRLELTGNQVDSLRLFDPKTQRSVQLIDKMQCNLATDASDLNSDKTILDYCNAKTLLVLDNYEAILPILKEYEVFDYPINSAVSAICSMSNPGYIIPVDLKKKINSFTKKLYFSPWSSATTSMKDDIVIPFAAVPQYGGKLNNFINDIKRKLESSYHIVIFSQQNERIYELLTDTGLHAYNISETGSVANPGRILICKGSLDAGWIWDDAIAVFTDYDIFGWAKQDRLIRKRPVKHHLYLNQLNEGGYVVHVDHGIGKFTGFSQIKNNDIDHEYLVLEYAAGDKLYVPVDQMERVSLYVGGKDQTPVLSRLHTQEWTQTKIRIKKSVENIARDLLKLYAIRETTMGFAFSPDTIWQREIESSFPYIETADQLNAMNEVKNDMEMNKPMDRLICGDVGYGKTEIALRAAFKAVMDSRQVAVLVPTTVLAQQHYQTFYDRLQAFPIKLAVLSRFSSDKEQNSVIKNLANGSVDICIGTHRLLQHDVIFKNLGLLIIDEEQRFGVAHKEFLKKLRREIDVLTLSATPIPRTLYMSLTGIKDFSTLETPPEDRLPINTFVGLYSTEIVREAILREIKRNGQVFYVHNRVNNIYVIEAELKLLIPECSILVAHGRMQEDELERVMSDFVKHNADILLTTTIIESGIDIPNVNTLIIDESERLGLTQLYQLRGRIGRGANTAFAYFFYRKNKYLTEQAKKRLNTIAEATELGAGYAIAMKDLEIRGAGNLLGTEQSGYIVAVGFDLYCRLLGQAVEEMKKENVDSTKEVSVEQPIMETSIFLPLNVYIPEAYITDINDRIWFYQRLAAAKKETDITEIETELSDRFGRLPDELHNLIYVAELKRYASELEIQSIYVKNNQVIISSNNINGNVKLVADKYVKKHSDSSIIVGTRQIKIDLNKTCDTWKGILIDLIQTLSNEA